jgi:hypothetical protein
MSGSDSISNPVARRINYTGSYPPARGSAPLGSAPLSSAQLIYHNDVSGGSHYANVSTDWSLTWHANCACWRHNYVMLMSSLSGSVLWVGSSGIWVGFAIRAKKMRGSRVARWCAWAASSPARVGACRHVPRQNFASFSPVASSLPSLHSGMVKTQFWQLSFLSKNQTPL